MATGVLDDAASTFAAKLPTLDLSFIWPVSYDNAQTWGAILALAFTSYEIFALRCPKSPFIILGVR